MGGDKPNSSFALGIIVHFTVCGFLFGYLWGRLYMLGLFREADLEKRIEKVEEINRQILDQRAKDLVQRQLDPSTNEVDSPKLREAIQKASDDERGEIMELVKDARTGVDATDVTKRRAIPVLDALIQADVAGIEHRYHSELGYIRLDLGQLNESRIELTKAIGILERRGKSGWRDYEYKRAVALIRQARDTGVCTPDVKKQIHADIRTAFSDPKNKDRYAQNRDIKEWLESNPPTTDRME